MRTLSAQELDDVFAGDGRVSATLPSVSVTAPHYSNSSYGFPYGGTSWAGPTYNESGGYCYQGAGSYFALSWDSQPNLEKLRCELDRNAMPGMSIPNTASLWFINDYAFKSRADGTVVHLPTNTPPANHDELHGQTDAAHNAIYLYAHGVLGTTTTDRYILPGETTERDPWKTNMSGFQHALFVAAHEAAHGQGIVGELQAEGYAVKALERYRANPNSCN